MKELADALRQFADRLERGECLPGATQCALVVGNNAGMLQATYIGRLVPANLAGAHLLAAGIQRLVSDQTATGPAVMSATRGSTH